MWAEKGMDGNELTSSFRTCLIPYNPFDLIVENCNDLSRQNLFYDMPLKFHGYLAFQEPIVNQESFSTYEYIFWRERGLALNPEGIPSDSPVRTQHRLYPAAQQAQPLEAPRISQDTGRMACVANWTNRRIVFYSGPHSKLSTFELLCYSVFRLEQGTKICYILPSKPKRTDGKGRFHSASGHKGMPHAFHFKSDTIMTQSSEP